MRGDQDGASIEVLLGRIVGHRDGPAQRIAAANKKSLSARNKNMHVTPQGSFVYSGAGKKQPADAPPEQKMCTDEACAIQRCLARNNHKQQRCEESIEAWKRCCREGARGRRPAAAAGAQRQGVVMMLLLNVHAAAAFSVATPMTTNNLFHDFDGHQTRYVKRAPTTSTSTSTKQPPVVLVHGFGGSAGQWRATIEDVAASGRTVYALDLLGFGMSPKPILPTKAGDGYSIELWSRQLQRFISEVVCEADGNDEAVIIGNSIGSLTCVCAASATSVTQQRYGGGKIAGVGLFNCAIGMNSKAEPLPTDPIAYAVFYNLIGRPLFILIDLLLKSPLSTLLFDKVRTKENVRQVLENGVYENGARVDEELVDMITRPRGG